MGCDGYFFFFYGVNEFESSCQKAYASVFIRPWISVFQIAFYGTSYFSELSPDLMMPSNEVLFHKKNFRPASQPI
jgi:hypothetical protein